MKKKIIMLIAAIVVIVGAIFGFKAWKNRENVSDNELNNVSGEVNTASGEVEQENTSGDLNEEIDFEKFIGSYKYEFPDEYIYGVEVIDFKDNALEMELSVYRSDTLRMVATFDDLTNPKGKVAIYDHEENISSKGDIILETDTKKMSIIINESFDSEETPSFKIEEGEMTFVVLQTYEYSDYTGTYYLDNDETKGKIEIVSFENENYNAIYTYSDGEKVEFVINMYGENGLGGGTFDNTGLDILKIYQSAEVDPEIYSEESAGYGSIQLNGSDIEFNIESYDEARRSLRLYQNFTKIG